MIVVAVLVLTLTTAIGVTVICRLIYHCSVLLIKLFYYRRYFRYTKRLQEERVEDGQNDVSQAQVFDRL